LSGDGTTDADRHYYRKSRFARCAPDVSRASLAPGLLAGMVLFDVLINLPGVSQASPLTSLLAPSLDLLVVLAVLMSAAYGSQRVRTGFAVGVSVFLALFLGWQAYLRWGAPGAARIAVLCMAAVGAGVASFFLSRLVLRGFNDAVLRSLFLLAAASCAVVQAILGVRIFSPSGMPGILRAIGQGFK